LAKSNRIANWAEPLTRGLPPPDPRSLCPLSSTEFVEPPDKTSWARHWPPPTSRHSSPLHYVEGSGNGNNPATLTPESTG
jgi:hypothetical protein